MNSTYHSHSNLRLAIVQSYDAENAFQGLTHINTLAYQFPSIGGILGKRNTTTVLRSTNHDWCKIILTLTLACKQRIEFLPVNTRGVMSSLGSFTTAVTVGGAIIFSIEVNHFEEV